MTSLIESSTSQEDHHYHHHHDACSSSSTSDSCHDSHHHHDHHHSTSLPLVVGPALVSPTAVANGCKSCYTRPPHLRAKCCGPGKAKLFKKKSKVLGAVLAESGLLAEMLQKQHESSQHLCEQNQNSVHDMAHHSTSKPSYIHLTQCTTSSVGEECNCTKESSIQEPQPKEDIHLDETLLEKANTSQLPALVDVSTHQEAIEKPSRMKSFLSGLLQRKQKVLVTLGFSDASSQSNIDISSSPPSSHVDTGISTSRIENN